MDSKFDGDFDDNCNDNDNDIEIKKMTIKEVERICLENKYKYYSTEFNINETTNISSIIFEDCFTKLQKKYYKNIKLDHHRFCIIIGKIKNNNLLNDSNNPDNKYYNYYKILIFEPLKYFKIPKNFNDFTLLHNSRHMFTKPYVIGCKDTCFGYMFALGFQLINNKYCKCDLYRNGQIIRLLQDDIKFILPYLFHSDKNKINNDNYKELDECNKDNILFDLFYKNFLVCK